MRERSAVLASVTFGFVAIASLSVQSTYAVAADECLNKPDSPAPQGQHWYYRMDRANNRQCWRLAQEGLHVQKSAPQTEKEAVPAVVAPPTAPVRAQNLETTGAATARAEATRAEATPDATPNPTTAAAPSPWPESPRMPDLPPSVQPAPQPEPVQNMQIAQTAQIASAGDAVPAAEKSEVATASEPPAAAPAEGPSLRALLAPIKDGEIDHTFALLMIVFAVLGIAGPIIHFVDRRRSRRIIISDEEPPRWARVVNLNTPAPRVHVPSDPVIVRRAPPIPPTPVDQTERLAQALQQLVDR